MRYFGPTLTVTAALLAFGCVAGPHTVSLSSTGPAADRALAAGKLVTLTGTVNVPAGLIANNSSGLVANNSSGLVSNNSGGLVANNTGRLGANAPEGWMAARSGSYRALAAEAWLPAAGLKVSLVDVNGQQAPGLDLVTTDARGSFAFNRVPEGTWVVEVTGPDLKLSCLTWVTEANASGLIVDPATTVTTEHFRRAFLAKQATPAQLDVNAVEALRRAVRGILMGDSTGLDLGSSEAAAGSFDRLEATHPEIQVADRATQLGTPITPPAAPSTPPATSSPGSPPSAALPSVAPTPQPSASVNSPAPAAPTTAATASPAPTPAPPMPAVFGLLPKSALPGSLVTLTGNNLGDVLMRGQVMFGSQRASIVSATATALVVSVPLGATDGPIAVTVNGQTASSDPFDVANIAGSFDAPGAYAVAIDAAGNAWSTCNTGGGSVEKISSTGTVLGTFRVGNNPLGVAVDRSSGNVWVTNQASNSVSLLGSDGATIATIPVVNNPRGVVVDSAGNAWVTLFGTNQLVKLSPTGAVLASYPTGPAPLYVAIDPTGNLWTSNLGNSNASCSVSKLSPAGALLGTFKPGTGIFGIAADANGCVWVSTVTGFAHKLGPTGVLLSSTPIIGAHAIAVDGAGNAWAVNSAWPNGIGVTKISPAGELLGYYHLPGYTEGVALDADGSAWVTDQGTNTVFKITP